MQLRPIPSVTRRELLRRSALLAGGASLAAILAACESSAPEERPPVLTDARGPITLPIHEDNQPIAGDLPIERDATLRIYQWHEYLYREVLDDFAHRYRAHGVGYEVESFETMAEAVARLHEPDARFDVFFPSIDALDGLVRARLLRPLEHSYLPNLRHLWPQFRGPTRPDYDAGARYTVPYTVYSTGIGWRTDMVRPADAPDALGNPYDVFWDRRYRGQVGVYDDYREAMAFAMLRRGVTDLNASDPATLRRAGDDLVAMARDVGVHVGVAGAYQELPTGEYAVQQAWSGDMLSAKRFGSVDSSARRHIAYAWPRNGIVGSDLTAICARGRSPVLAHAFLNHLLDPRVAMENFSWNGYQPPIEGITPEAFADPTLRWRSLVPDHLRTAILAPEDLESAHTLRPLGAAEQSMWLAQWQRFLAVADVEHDG